MTNQVQGRKTYRKWKSPNSYARFFLDNTERGDSFTATRFLKDMEWKNPNLPKVNRSRLVKSLVEYCSRDGKGIAMTTDKTGRYRVFVRKDSSPVK